MLSAVIAPLSWNAAALPASASARRAWLPTSCVLLWVWEVGRWAEAIRDCNVGRGRQRLQSGTRTAWHSLGIRVVRQAGAGPILSGPPTTVRRAGSRAAVDMREMLIAGNWKMNTLLPEAVSLAKEVAEAAKTAPCGVAVCAPFPYLTAVKDALKGSKVGLGAQDCYAEADAGAFTGATSTAMLESAAPHV